ncbi:MAG: ATP-binding cassette domain-containing protein [Clostridia bacterium]|nr:ATP-binding cassette domain-containing protein [Clostridia bacterium]
MASFKKRQIGWGIFLSLITLGIYAIFWEYSLIKNIKTLRGESSGCAKELLLFIFIPFYACYWFYSRGKLLHEELTRRERYVASSGGVLLFLTFIGFGLAAMAIMQSDFNDLASSPDEANKGMGLVRYISPFAGWAVGSIFLVMISTVMQMLPAGLTKQMIEFGIQKADTQAILRIGMQMIAVAVGGGILSVLGTYVTSKAASGYSKELRKVIFRKAQTLSQSNINKISVASLITRTSNDILTVQQMVITVMQQIFAVPILFVGGMVLAIRESKDLAKIILVAIPIIAVIFAVLVILFMPMFKKQQKLVDRLNQIIREKIGGVRVIRAFNRNEYEEQRFRTTNFELTSIALKIQRIFAFMLPVAILLAFLLVGYLMYYTGSHAASLDPTIAAQRAELEGTIGSLTAFVSYFVLVIGAVTMAAAVIAVIPRASISSKRILEVMNTVPDVKDPAQPVAQDPEKHGWVEFRDVSFTYPDELERGKEAKPKGKLRALWKESVAKVNEESKAKAQKKADPADADKQPDRPLTEFEKEEKEQISLKNISFVSRPGEVTAILGGTGSGKSTLVSLIPRLFDVTEGEILVGGVNVKEQSFEELNASIAYIPQKAYLFSGTIADNLRFGKPDATEEDIDRALSIAQAKIFVEQMPEGIESPISQGGTNVSGGQRQRLAIARAVIKNADICIFDDSFSALDLATDAKLRAAIKAEMSNANIIIVAQRIGTILDADRIIVLDKGAVVGMGKHQELMESCDIYKEMVASQLTPEEVAASL